MDGRCYRGVISFFSLPLPCPPWPSPFLPVLPLSYLTCPYPPPLHFSSTRHNPLPHKASFEYGSMYSLCCLVHKCVPIPSFLLYAPNSLAHAHSQSHSPLLFRLSFSSPPLSPLLSTTPPPHHRPPSLHYNLHPMHIRHAHTPFRRAAPEYTSYYYYYTPIPPVDVCNTSSTTTLPYHTLHTILTILRISTGSTTITDYLTDYCNTVSLVTYFPPRDH